MEIATTGRPLRRQSVVTSVCLNLRMSMHIVVFVQTNVVASIAYEVPAWAISTSGCRPCWVKRCIFKCFSLKLNSILSLRSDLITMVIVNCTIHVFYKTRTQFIINAFVAKILAILLYFSTIMIHLITSNMVYNWIRHFDFGIFQSVYFLLIMSIDI